MVVNEASDEELIASSRAGDEAARRAALEALFSRHYARVASWCLRLAGDRDEAAELAQEVFLRVQTRLDSFRGDSRFTTWLYQVTRSVALNRFEQQRRRAVGSLDDEDVAEPSDPAPSALERMADGELRARFQQALREDLQPLEGQVLYLHFGLGMRLDAITRMLGLSNASGAKAYVVAAKRKLARGFGRWLQGTDGEGTR
jgi:RNA polymerase sigma-70 factor (ECF subfamily)